MSVVSLEGFSPSRRFDSIPWTGAIVQESPASTGPWTDLHTFNFSDPDVDPADPKERDFTVIGTINQGWYRVIFFDSGSHQLQPTTPVQNTLTFQASNEQVARLIMSRTRDTFGNVLGTFTDNTLPTADEVERIIGDATLSLSKQIGDTIPDALLDDASRVVAILAAMQIELSFYSDQVNTGRSIYPQLEAMLKTEITNLQRSISLFSEGETGVTNTGPGSKASWGFPTPGIDWDTKVM